MAKKSPAALIAGMTPEVAEVWAAKCLIDDMCFLEPISDVARDGPCPSCGDPWDSPAHTWSKDDLRRAEEVLARAFPIEK
jgi:hypothetical protein